MAGTMTLQVGLLLAFPAFAAWLSGRFEIVRRLGPVLVCYGVGIAVGNQKWIELDSMLSLKIGSGAVVLALPLLLLPMDIPQWTRMARPTLISFVLCVVSVGSTTLLASWFFASRIPEHWQVGGLLVGVYTGGPANLAAVATALKVEPNVLLAVHASDVFLCGLYFLFLVTLAGPLFARFLPAYERVQVAEGQEPRVEAALRGASRRGLETAYAIGVGLCLVALAALLSLLLPGLDRDTVIILAVTGIAILGSFHPRLRATPRAYETGDFLLLIFCLSVGTMADFSRFDASNIATLAYTAFVLFGTVVVHLGLCRLFKIDRDTSIITFTALIFSPAFVAPVAARLRNREVVVSGVTAGVAGFAIGTYLALVIALALRQIR